MARRKWIESLDAQPMDFFVRELEPAWLAARDKLATFVGASAGDLIFVENATVGMNIVADSFPLAAGDEVLLTDHEYGAVNNTWTFNCQRTGAKYVNWPMPLPMTTPEAFVDRLWEGVTPRTRVITFSHITSPTALIFPAELICRRARAEAGAGDHVCPTARARAGR